jgi:multisubunit Na+/H+ antiporter MnhG subunit
MGLDIRFPIGAMFSIIGLLLAAFGLFSSPDLYHRSLGININLWWGLALVIFGATMLWLAWRKTAAAVRSGSGRTQAAVGEAHSSG